MGAEAQTIATPARPAPYTSHSIETAAGRLHYLDYGSAGRPPMLCLHGGAANGHWFDFVASGFNGDCHVRALDQRGHGDSAWIDPPAYRYEHYVADLAEVVERLDLRDFILVGHSMGGMVSLAYAATHPGRVARLVIVDTTMRMSEERLDAMREVGNRPGRPYASLEEFAERFRLRPPGSLAPPEIIRHIGRNSARQTARGEWRHKFDRNVYLMRPALDGIPYWSEIRIPALLVKGALSARLSPDVLAEIRARCPRAELAEVAASDHHVTLDNPAGFVSVVRDFLARHRN
ncbi:MAG TPA: alpha/beta hydrolase [Burkholderiales bacterium]|jgi:pimeloyl-ACP methyl ester carboxylesterase|nr:alpha/beta hydrolase [Burkholderiales bacterium]